MDEKWIDYVCISSGYHIAEAEFHGLTKLDLQQRSFYEVMTRLTREMPRVDLTFPLTFEVKIYEIEEKGVYRMALHMGVKKKKDDE